MPPPTPPPPTLPPRLAHEPDGPIAVPLPIAERAGADEVTPVWINQVGGITFQLGDGPGRRFAKWAPHGRGLDLHAEEARLRWAVAYTPVPQVLESGSTAEADWLLTAGLPGRSAVDRRWLADPEPAVKAAGVGLRRLHDALPVDECPFDWSVESRVARSEKSTAQDPWFRSVPSVDSLVVCHGDPCVPNTLLLDDGSWRAHVDLDALGVADRWADLAVATMSLGWNYGEGWDEVFLDAYGIDADPARTAFYRDLWNAT